MTFCKSRPEDTYAHSSLTGLASYLPRLPLACTSYWIMQVWCRMYYSKILLERKNFRSLIGDGNRVLKVRRK